MECHVGVFVAIKLFSKQLVYLTLRNTKFFLLCREMRAAIATQIGNGLLWVIFNVLSGWKKRSAKRKEKNQRNFFSKMSSPQEQAIERLTKLEALVTKMAELQVKKAPEDGALLQFLKEQDRRHVDKWLSVASRLEGQREEFRVETTEMRQALFLDLAKAKMLTQDQVMVMTYTLYGTSEDQGFFMSMQLRMSGQELIRAHNFFVASGREKGFLSSYGDLLVSMPWPLFPPGKEFSALNQQLLVEASSLLGGGGRTCSLFKDSLLGGGYSVPVQDCQGPQPFVVLDEVENTVGGILQRLARLE